MNNEVKQMQDIENKIKELETKYRILDSEILQIKEINEFNSSSPTSEEESFTNMSGGKKKKITRKDLIIILNKYGIKGVSNLKKDQLVKFVKKLHKKLIS